MVIFGFRVRVSFFGLKLLLKCLKLVSSMATWSLIGIGEHTLVKKFDILFFFILSLKLVPGHYWLDSSGLLITNCMMSMWIL